MPHAQVLELPDLATACQQWRAEGGIVVLAHGTFDPVHVGHMQHLRAAKALGNHLVVTVTADAYVAKGPGRPRFPDYLRAESLTHLIWVDGVAICHHSTAIEVIEALRPNVYVKGLEYRDYKTPRLLAEEETLKRCGGRLDFVTGDVVASATELLEKIDRV